MPAATLEPPAKPADQPKVVIPPIGAPKPPPAPAKEPAKPAEPKPPAGELPEIPTGIIPGTEKSPAKYAEERRKAKLDEAAKKLGVPDMEAELLELRSFKEKATPWEAELTQERTKRTEFESRVTELSARQAELAKQAEEANSRYYDDFKVQFNPDEDQELRTAHQALTGTLLAKMPNMIPGADGNDQRIFFGKVLDNPQSAHQVEQAMELYIKAEQNGDSKGAESAVNLMLLAAGAPVKFSRNPDEERLIDPSAPSFMKTEQAMRDAMPAYAKKAERGQYVREQAPQLVQQQISQREGTIRDNLRLGLFLGDDERASLAAVNPMDSRVLIGDILAHSPELKESVNAWIAAKAPALARIGRIQMPTLASNDPKAVAAHRQEAQRYQGELADMASMAAVGRVAGPIITSMMGELAALRSRVAGVAENENAGAPGGESERGGGGGAPPPIPTNIMPK